MKKQTILPILLLATQNVWANWFNVRETTCDTRTQHNIPCRVELTLPAVGANQTVVSAAILYLGNHQVHEVQRKTVYNSNSVAVENTLTLNNKMAQFKRIKDDYVCFESADNQICANMVMLSF